MIYLANLTPEEQINFISSKINDKMTLDEVIEVTTQYKTSYEAINLFKEKYNACGTKSMTEAAEKFQEDSVKIDSN